MAVINTHKGTGSGTGEFTLLETDVYRMQIKAADLQEDQYADVNRDGSRPERLVLRWEVTQVTDEQDEAALGCAVWQRFNPYYGPVRDGGVSKFQQFIDGLRAQGYLADFDPELFDTDSLVGIEQRVSVEKHIKSMGSNAGKPGNKITSVLPLRRSKGKSTPVEAPAPRAAARPAIIDGDEDLPF